MMKKITYKQSGVDISRAEDFTKKIKLSNLGNLEAFGSLFNLKPLLKNYKHPLLVASADGVGTKLKVAQGLNIHHTVGIDLVAMNVNDIVCIGAKPLFFLDYIACGKVKVKTLSEVVDGIKRGLRNSDCLLLGGETAEMPGMYKPKEYDLAGFCLGIVDRDKIIDGRNIKPKDLIIGLESSGVHSNGFSLVRKALGPKGVKKYARELLMPTRIYVKPILSLLSTINYQLSTIKGIAHITGGAFYHKATKILPKGLGMVIDKKAWKVPKIFKLIQEKGNIGDKQMYSVFNMGLGMIVVVDRKVGKKVLTILKKFNFNSYIVGEIIKASLPLKLI